MGEVIVSRLRNGRAKRFGFLSQAEMACSMVLGVIPLFEEASLEQGSEGSRDVAFRDMKSLHGARRGVLARIDKIKGNQKTLEGREPIRGSGFCDGALIILEHQPRHLDEIGIDFHKWF